MYHHRAAFSDQRIRRRLLTGEPTGDGFDFVGDIDRFDLR